MTDLPRSHPPPPPPRPPRQSDSGCLAGLLVLVGIVLLLPGLCAVVLVGSDPKRVLTDSTGLQLVFMCMASVAGGVALIWAAGRIR